MAVCRAPRRNGDWRGDDFRATRSVQHSGGASHMTKKYAVIRKRVPQPGGGFIEAFELGLVELFCLGETYYDAAGYPYDDAVHAFTDDWARLGGDFKRAAVKTTLIAVAAATR